MSSANSSSLRPAWRNQSGGRGFQPPPSVASERARSQSVGSSADNSGGGAGGGAGGADRATTYNKFSALDDDEEGLESSGGVAGGSSGGPPSVIAQPKGNSRSEALRQGLGPRSASIGTKPSGTGGRRLADLAAQAPASDRPTGYAGNRFISSRPAQLSASAPLDDGKVIRFTREKLLSMRPSPSRVFPDVLKEFQGNIFISEEPQDPVCWDTFDAEEIWATIPRRPAKPAAGGRTLADMAGEQVVAPASRVRQVGGSSAGRWQRGVALPPTSTAADAKSRRDKDADNPNDLWDDPVSGAAAGDFSAFGDAKEDDVEPMAPFDFERMAEDSRLLEEELHGSENIRSRASSEGTEQDFASSQQQNSNGESNIPAVKKSIDPHRPLASVGTTIRSGSGDDVNVFEDFDEPGSSDGTPTAVDPDMKEDLPVDLVDYNEKPNNSNVNSVSEDVDATTRLMAMIGVSSPAKSGLEQPSPVVVDPEPESTIELQSNQQPISSAWSIPPSPRSENTIDGISIPLNPWGRPLLQGSLLHPSVNEVKGLDLQARLREEELARRRQELEAQKRAIEIQQAAAAAAAVRQQQQVGLQNQVELVLMERISNILENSWGRSDLISILTTLHAEDSRVIALLSSIDALRSLIMRYSSRVQLRHDTAYGAEMAILLSTNAQWQQQQQLQQQAQQEALLRARQEEELRRLEQLRLEEERAAAAALRNRLKPVVPGAPWFYSDPQQNIQGPFRGEEMRQWFEAGYFKGDLPISQDSTGPFRQLQEIFPDLSMAFIYHDSGSQGAVEEESRRRADQLEFERQREAEAKAARDAAELEERERLVREAAEMELKAREAAEVAGRERERLEMEQAAYEAEETEEVDEAGDHLNGGNESSAQLKMMLGLSALTHQPPTNDVEYGGVSPKRNKANKKNVSTVKMSQPPQVATNESLMPSLPKLASSAWGSPTSSSVSKKSMSEIQQEEARLAAYQATQRERSAQPSSGWANVAAATKNSPAVTVTTWSNSAAKLQPAVVGSKPTTPSAAKPVQVRKQSTGGSRAQVANVATASSQVTATPKQMSASVGGDDFGANMSPALEKWCKEQMTKLNGTDDLTLVSFCMTLKDPNEIRQYLVTYLGSSPQVNSFANEFIQRKVGVKPVKQEEWETTAATKKKGKKKTTTTSGR